MELRSLGTSEVKITPIIMGTWQAGKEMWVGIDDSETIEALRAAFEAGITTIDTAEYYGNGHSERIVGEALADVRGQVVYATKVFSNHLRYDQVMEACHGSLKNLKTDYLDLYQIHWPAGSWGTELVPIEETMRALNDLKQQGEIRAIGVSVPDTTPDNVIGSLVRGRVDSIQVIYNIFEQYPEWNLFPVCEKEGTAVIVRVPFDEGALTGKFTPETTFAEGDVRNHYFRGNNLKSVVQKVNTIREYKDREFPQLSMADLALKFCLTHPAVGTVIPGIRNVAQADMNTRISDGTYMTLSQQKEIKQFSWRKDFWFNEVDQTTL